MIRSDGVLGEKVTIAWKRRGLAGAVRRGSALSLTYRMKGGKWVEESERKLRWEGEGEKGRGIVEGIGGSRGMFEGGGKKN